MMNLPLYDNTIFKKKKEEKNRKFFNFLYHYVSFTYDKFMCWKSTFFNLTTEQSFHKNYSCVQ